MSTRLGEYALGRKLSLYAELGSLEFYEAEREGQPRLLALAREDLPELPDYKRWQQAFNQDCFRLLHAPMPGVLRAHRYGQRVAPERLYLELEAPGGPTLAAWRRSPAGPRLPPGPALAVTAQLGEILAAVRAGDGMFPPLQPDTAFLGRNGEVRLLPDFTWVWELESPSFTGQIVELGLPPANEPGNADTALVFRLGTILLELLRGSHLLAGLAPRDWQAAMRGALPRPSALSPAYAPLDEVVARCTAPEGQRYANPAEAAEALWALAGQLRGTDPAEARTALAEALGRLACAVPDSEEK